MGAREFFASCALAGMWGCLVENPAWYADDGGSSGSQGTSRGSATESGSQASSSSAEGTTLDIPDLPTSSSGSSSSSSTDGGGNPNGFTCSDTATPVPLPVSPGWTDFDVNARAADVVVSVLENERLQVFAVDPSGVTNLLDEAFGGLSVIGSLRDDELVLGIGGSDGAPATLVRTTLGSGAAQELGSFTIPIFPVRGLLRGAGDGFSILTRTQAGRDSPAYLTRLDASRVPLSQTDAEILSFGNTTWFVGSEDEDGRGWLVLRRKPTDTCIVLELLPDGAVGESWEFADECYDPDVTPFGSGAAVSYHRTEADRNVYVRTFRPSQPPSIELSLGTGGADESDANLVTRGGTALVVWSVDGTSLGGAVVQLDSGGIERFPSDIASVSSAGGNMWAFATLDGTAGAVHPSGEGGIQVTFLCGSD